jgi:N-glycosidase YbiA
MREDSVKVIDKFDGTENRFLSNFYPAAVTLDGVTYPTVEHAYQAAKTFDLSDRQRILNCPPPNIAKKIGRKVKARSDWEQVKVEVMTDLVRQKFTDHPELKAQLLATGDATLVEGNWWGDRFWGVCNGEGQNYLGRILMDVRKELQTNETTPRS